LLDDVHKIKRRRFRREVLGPYLSQTLKGWAIHQKYLEKAQGEISPDKSVALLMKAKKLYDEFLSPRYAILQYFSAIPSDAPLRCRCGTTAMHCLPDELLSQVVHIESLNVLPIRDLNIGNNNRDIAFAYLRFLRLFV